MLIAFKLGPLEFQDAPSDNVYIAVDASLGPAALASAPNDTRGLEKLRKQLAGAPLTCEPSLGLAARRLGLPVAPLPDDVVRSRGALALGLAIGPELKFSPELLEALALAARDFEQARPWERWAHEELFEVELRGAVRGKREAVVMGGLGDTFGLAMYDEPGTVARLGSARDGNAEERRTRSTTLLFDDQPAFARAPLHEAFGSNWVPMPVRRDKGKTRLPEREELLALTAVLRAVARAKPASEVIEHEMAAGPVRIAVKVKIPAPIDDRDAQVLELEPGPLAPEASEASLLPGAVPEVPRNAPCPCGSGKKYKKCHGLQQAAAALGRLQPHEADALQRRLVREMSPERRKQAMASYPVPFETLEDHDMQLFGPWSIFTFRWEGQTEAERRLASEGHRLPEREKAFLEAQRHAPWSIFEVEAVRRGEGLTLLDLLTGERLQVIERSGSQILEPWVGVLARPVQDGGETRIYGTHARPLAPEALRLAEAQVRELLGVDDEQRVPRERLLQPGTAELLIRAWEEVIEAWENRPPPELHNTDGDLLEPVKLLFAFDPAEHDAIAAGLEALTEPPERHRGEAIYTFFRSGNRMHPDWENTVLGRAILKKTALELEANSRKRATSLRQKVTRKLGKKLRFVSR